MNKPQLLKKNYLYFTGLLLLVTGLPVSLFLTSVSQFVLMAAFLAEGDVKEKFRRFLSNKTALLFSGIWLMHLIGMVWTSDINEGLKDLRIKLPVLLLPLFLAGSKPLTKKQFEWVLIIFISSVFIGSMISMAVLVGIIERNISDIREIFIFNISHIRFSLFTCLSVFALGWITFRKDNRASITRKIFSASIMTWFILFLVIIESVTGLIIFSSVLLLLLFYSAFTSGKLSVRIILLLIVILVPVGFVLAIKKFVSDYYQNHPYPVNTNDKTKQGNNYVFNLSDPLYENGYPVWVYVCEDELREEWNKKSTISYDSTDERSQPLKFTLIRFLSSKGLRKDAEGLSMLSVEEVRSVERGIANVNYQEISSMHARLLQIMWEFDQFIKGGNVSGHSVTQRFEFWKTGWGIARSNLLTGVGTGDMPDAYEKQYIESGSKLDKKHRLRAHNQFLAILVAFGVCGLFYFLFAYFYPVAFLKEKTGFMFAVFFLIGLLSMFSEDTLETQAGATFIAFFFSFFSFSKPVQDEGLDSLK